MHVDYKWELEAPLSFYDDYPVINKCMERYKCKTVIDLGCGNGAIDLELLNAGYEVFGVDSSKSGIDAANSEYRRINPLDKSQRFFYQDFDEQMDGEITNRSYDTVISAQVIEHVYSPNAYIKLCATLLPVGGKLIITTPYHGYLKNLMLAITGKLDKHFTALWEGGHIKFWSKATLGKLLSENGFQVKEFKGIGRAPYLWRSMLFVAVKQ